MPLQERADGRGSTGYVAAFPGRLFYMAQRRLKSKLVRTPLETSRYKSKLRKRRTSKLLKHSRKAVSRLVKRAGFDERRYEIDVSYRRPNSIEDVHTIPDLVRMAENNKHVQIEGKILHLTPEG